MVFYKIKRREQAEYAAEENEVNHILFGKNRHILTEGISQFKFLLFGLNENEFSDNEPLFTQSI